MKMGMGKRGNAIWTSALALIAAGSPIGSPALAQAAPASSPADPLAAKFGARESIHSIGLSPDGTQIVIVAPRPAGGENAVVVNLASSAAVPVLSSKGGSEQLTQCFFVVESRVICGIYLFEGSNRSVDAATRMVTVANDGSSMKMLSARTSGNAYYNSNYGGDVIDYNVPGSPNAVLMTRWFPQEMTTGALTANKDYGLGVEQVDVVTLARKNVEAKRPIGAGYITDGMGKVRILATQPISGSGQVQRVVNYQYRKPDGGWEALSSVTQGPSGSTGFEPVAVDPLQNVAYGFDANGNYTALYKRALDGSGTTTLVLGRPDADVDHLLRIGRDRRVIGASYATERRRVEMFDPEMKRLAGALGRALGGRSVSIVDSTADEGKLLLFAGSDTDPGTFYLYDKATHGLGELLPARPELAGMKFGEQKPVQYPAADGTMIPAYLTLPPGSDGKNLPAIVMPHGGPSARDEWGFDWLSQYFAAKGYAVIQPNYRGSSGLGANWMHKNGFQSWETAIGDVNSAGKWLTAQGIAAPGKLAIFGWSYGGYAALQSAVLEPDLFKAVVAVAPVTDMEKWRDELRDTPMFSIRDDFIGAGPHVAAGSPARHADRFKAPVLLFHGDADLNVGVEESRLMKSRLEAAGKRVEYVEFPGLMHQLDDAGARALMLSGSDAFIRKALGL